MCGRYSLTEKDFGVIADELGARWEQELGAAHAPRYNVAPTNVMPIARLAPGAPADARPELIGARWGFVAGRMHINARAERAAVAPMFKDAFAARRCVVPADGFYEWREAPGGKKQPIWFHRPEGGLVWLAGLWTADAKTGDATYLILTTSPNGVVRGTHDRMPVVLDHERARYWLAHADGSILAPADDAVLVATPVSTRVSDVRNDDPSCLEPPEPEKQTSLFQV